MSLAEQCDCFHRKQNVISYHVKKPLNTHMTCLNAHLANVLFVSYKLEVPRGGFGRIRGNKSTL